MYLRGNAQLKRLGQFLCSLCETVQTLAAFYSNLSDIGVSEFCGHQYIKKATEVANVQIFIFCCMWNSEVSSLPSSITHVALTFIVFSYGHHPSTSDMTAEHTSPRRFQSHNSPRLETKRLFFYTSLALLRCTGRVCLSFETILWKRVTQINTQIKTDDVYGFKITLGCVVSCESREKRTQRCWLFGGITVENSAQLYETFTFDYIQQ